MRERNAWEESLWCQQWSEVSNKLDKNKVAKMFIWTKHYQHYNSYKWWLLIMTNEMLWYCWKVYITDIYQSCLLTRLILARRPRSDLLILKLLCLCLISDDLPSSLNIPVACPVKPLSVCPKNLGLGQMFWHALTNFGMYQHKLYNY